ncbi:hypothetical protein [Nostoc sp.]|uniref:hypothetical protein n=1 Tax=Nostoc sp. TaxID=1180 RepID=UPI002FF550EB
MLHGIRLDNNLAVRKAMSTTSVPAASLKIVSQPSLDFESSLREATPNNPKSKI